MEFPFGHNNHNHNHRREDNEGFGQPPPPPFSSSLFPPPPNQPFHGGAFPHGPPDSYTPSYGAGAYSQPPPPADSYSHSYSDTYNQPPPPVDSYSHSYGGNYNQPPPPADSYSHSYGGAYNQPPPPVLGGFNSSHTPHMESQGYPHAPAATAGVVSHAHNSGEKEGSHGHHGFHPHMPSFSHHESTNTHTTYGGDGPLMGYFANKPTFKIHCRASADRFSIGVRDGKVVLCQSDPDDLTQHWYKDEKYSTKVKDKEGHPSFSLVNKATGQAVKHSVSAHPVQLIPYKPENLDESILWTESKDLGSGFRCIRMVVNVKVGLDALNGDKDHGGVHDGTIVAVYEFWKGNNYNQQWKLIPY